MTLYVDFKLASDRDITRSEDGGFQTVKNYPAAVQDIAIDIDSDVRDLIGTPVTQKDIDRLKAAIRRGLDKHEFVDDVHRVMIREVRDDGQRVDVSIFVDQNEQLDFTARF